MNTHNKESVQQRLQMSYGHTEPYIVSYRETNQITGKNDPTLKINRLKIGRIFRFYTNFAVPIKQI